MHKLTPLGRPHKPRYRQRTVRQLYDQAESHLWLPRLTRWNQPRKWQERLWKPTCRLDHVYVCSCDRSGGVGAVALRRSYMSYMAKLNIVVS